MVDANSNANDSENRNLAGNGHTQYTVGYRRPPRQSQFKPGQSGNTRGRPKGSRNLTSQVHDAFARPVSVRVGTRPRTMSAIVAVIAIQMQKALQGDTGATQILLRVARDLKLLDEKTQPFKVEICGDDARL